MHKLMLISDENGLKDLNTLLEAQEWWVSHITHGAAGQWMVVLTDVDPDVAEEDEGDLFLDDDMMEFELEEHEGEPH